jgi:aryl-alcohol dehydrogenase-like predicted oxidoreductase
METRQLSDTDLRLSVKGLGTWAFGGDGWAGSWGPQPPEDCEHALRTAVELGVNWIDTAPAYGLGRSEELVGDLLARLGVDVLVATKCGERIGAEGTYRSGDPAGIRADCESSLRRLRRDVIDLYQLHHPPPDVPIEESWQAMRELVDEGKVRYIGLCNAPLALVHACHVISPVASYQGPYSPLRRKLEDEIVPYCVREGIGLLPFGALGHGFLSRRRQRSEFAVDDWRNAERWLPEFTRGQRLVDALAQATGEGVPVGALTSQWLIDRKGVVATPIGARTPAQAMETFGGPDVGHLMATVDDMVEQHRAA